MGIQNLNRLLVFLLMTALSTPWGASLVLAVPSFARQIGLPGEPCHTFFPALTPFGRKLKLEGYTLLLDGGLAQQVAGRGGYAGYSGRNAKDNNSIYALAWFMF